MRAVPVQRESPCACPQSNSRWRFSGVTPARSSSKVNFFGMEGMVTRKPSFSMCNSTATPRAMASPVTRAYGRRIAREWPHWDTFVWFCMMLPSVYFKDILESKGKQASYQKTNRHFDFLGVLSRLLWTNRKAEFLLFQGNSALFALLWSMNWWRRRESNFNHSRMILFE